jgi:hypothetical protein
MVSANLLQVICALNMYPSKVYGRMHTRRKSYDNMQKKILSHAPIASIHLYIY